MKSPFPGMDPYLEHRGIWSEVHTDLIVGIRRFLTPILRPKYRVAIEQRTYLALSAPDDLIGEPDVIVAVDDQSEYQMSGATSAASVEPLVGQLPLPEEVKERYLEIRTVDTKEVVTVIEILSPADKRSGAGREEYESKRGEILGSRTNLIEIDLLRAGRPLPMRVAKQSHYRIIVSRSNRPPSADFYLFSVRQPIPAIPVPLIEGEAEPHLELNRILHEIYDQSGYDLAIDYSQTPPPPAFTEADSTWVHEIASSFLTSMRTNGDAGV